ncbi:MAG: hypothetical protein JNG86_10980, partial [Verrucomicrobiaceae bacterium]|nr:hypothetical protein [Verrucomicrobiaceae bacterium]
MHTSPLLRLVCVSAGLWIGTTASAQQPPAAPDDPALQRVEKELGVDKVPPPQALTRGFRARGSTDAAPPPPPPPTEPRKGFRIRGGVTVVRGGELPPESSPVVLSTPPSQAAPASPPPPPAVTVQEKQAQKVAV